MACIQRLYAGGFALEPTEYESEKLDHTSRASGALFM